VLERGAEAAKEESSPIVDPQQETSFLAQAVLLLLLMEADKAVALVYYLKVTRKVHLLERDWLMTSQTVLALEPRPVDTKPGGKETGLGVRIMEGCDSMHPAGLVSDASKHYEAFYRRVYTQSGNI
jgi:hypothetical protein